MDAGLADEAEPPRATSASRVNPRDPPPSRRPCRRPRCRLRPRPAAPRAAWRNRAGVRPVDAEGLEEIAQAELESDDARMGRRDLERRAEALAATRYWRGCRWAVDPPLRLHAGERGGRGPHVLRGLGLGQVDHVHPRPHHRGEVRLEVRGRQPVHPDDEDLAGESCRAAARRPAQESFQDPARVGLPALLDRVLQVEREGVGLTGQRLRRRARAARRARRACSASGGRPRSDHRARANALPRQ